MICGSCVARLIAAALALCAPATMVLAATPPAQATANAAIIHPVTVTKLKDMDFGYVAVTTAGTAVLEPNVDSYSTTGGVTAVGGTPHCAEFLGAAQSNSVVNIKVPNQPSTLTRVGHRNDHCIQFHAAGPEQARARQGAKLHLPSWGNPQRPRGQVQGTYVGTFSVTVQYP